MDLFKTFSVQLDVIENSALKQNIRKISFSIKCSPECGIFYLHFGYAAPPFIEQHRNKDKEGCGGAVWTDLEVPAGIDRKDHVETCRVDEHMAYID
ncbi:hypothetical protein T12_4444 [Trichinella patagoniensis]|uniref:Uncharacterized protein n=1 Tax=Trichinella patagoniensis TaxID=990121 RepID=A0A0V0ZUT0_9BILA|nr:hypothetical protein T12_4444 [Trichinella patagoniensis]